MNLIKGALPFYCLSFFISLISVPLIKRIGFRLKIYALENERTVHSGKIVRIGGLAIYCAFLVGMSFFVRADRTINAIMIGSIIIFITGIIDDIYDIEAKYKFLGQVLAALIVIFMGNIEIGSLNFLTTLRLSFLIPVISFFISLFWIVGVTNAVNLIDGLDGLSCGISFIVLCTIGLLGFFLGRRDITIMSLILTGGISGFLFYNFHPASIFVGDCGALFLGYMIATLSLMGFKTSTFITLGFPIIILFIPLSDTVLAIIRRKIKGQRISEADKSHLHHVLMFKIGLSHRNTVLSLYLVTLLFGLDAILVYFDEFLGILFLFLLSFLVWIFIELTGMINPKFHPVIGLIRRIFGYPKKREDAFFEANRLNKDDNKL